MKLTYKELHFAWYNWEFVVTQKDVTAIRDGATDWQLRVSLPDDFTNDDAVRAVLAVAPATLFKHDKPEIQEQPYFDVTFDGPPGPVAGRFVDVHDRDGKSVKLGEWVDHGDGYWSLRISKDTLAQETPEATAEEPRRAE